MKVESNGLDGESEAGKGGITPREIVEKKKINNYR